MARVSADSNNLLDCLLGETRAIQLEVQTEDPFHPRFGKVVTDLHHVLNRFTELNLSGRNLGDCVVEVIVRALSECPLRSLDLSFNDIGSRGGTALARAIENDCLPALEVLELTGNSSLGEGLSEGLSDGLMTLVRALAWRTTRTRLKRLKLQECCSYQWWDKNIEEFAEACKSSNMNELTHLYLPRHSVSENLLPLAKLLMDGSLPKLAVLGLWKVEWQGMCGKLFTNAVQYNPCLVFDIVSDNEQPHEAKFTQYKEQNGKRMQQLRRERHGEEKATYGKIIFCGPEGQGKTTLRKTLQNCRKRDQIAAFTKISRKVAQNEPSTRGIEVSYIISKEKPGDPPAVNLALWDLVGHSESDVLHSALVTKLALADGIATTFLLVCNADYNDSTSESQVLHWMRRIAATSVRGGDRGSDRGKQRQVILVLNRFKDKKCGQLECWNKLLERYADQFKAYLNIDTNPFVLHAKLPRSFSRSSEKYGAADRQSVRSLQMHLIQETRRRLETKMVPKISRVMKDIIAGFVRDKEFVCKSWGEFAQIFTRAEVDNDTLKAATDYLHESGLIIFFRGSEESSSGEGSSSQEGSSSEDRGKGESLVIMNPGSFCKEVVGNFLLPQASLKRNEIVDSHRDSHRPHFDGTLNRTDLESHFKSLNVRGTQVTSIVDILVRLGVCYKVSSDRVLIPTLIQDDTNQSGFWGGEAVMNQWVMGYCLRVKHRETTLLPSAVMITVFRNLQVELALDPNYSGGDKQYTAANHYITFKSDGLLVLVEISPDERDHDLQDRVDILVRPQVSRRNDQHANDWKERQMEKALTIVEKFFCLASKWCPGVEVTNEVFKPWKTAESRKPMSKRQEKISVGDLQHHIEKCGSTAVDLQWVMDGKNIKVVDLLPRRELRGWANSVHRNCDSGETMLVDSELVISHEVNYTWSSSEFSDIIDRLEQVLRFSHEQIERTVPKFMYLTNPKESSGRWLSAKELLRPVKGRLMERATLHFLCELKYENHTCHEVRAQEGMEIDNLKRWAAKISPWLNVSVKIAAMLGKIGSQAVLPGAGQLIDAITSGGVHDDAGIGAAVANFSNAILIAGGDVPVSDRRGSTPSLASLIGVDQVEVREGTKEVMEMVIKNMPPGQFQAKFKLRKARRIGPGPDAGRVVWVCDECSEKHVKDGAIRFL